MKIELNTKIRFNNIVELDELIQHINMQYSKVYYSFNVYGDSWKESIDFNEKPIIMIQERTSFYNYKYDATFCIETSCENCKGWECKEWELVTYKSRKKKLERVLDGK